MGLKRLAVMCLTLSLASIRIPVFADDFFVQKVEPILKSRCYDCHSHAASIEGGLALDYKSGWQKGGESGPAVVPGKPESSLLITAISHIEKDLKMPPDKRLPADEIASLTEWIKRGAVDPRVGEPEANATNAASKEAWNIEFQKRRDWWSLKPPAVVNPPVLEGSSTENVDAFIRMRLAENKLTPAPAADPAVLLRRLSLVLTGLPPTARDVLDFQQSHDDAAFRQHVDRLLSSQHFGERFARHWMDVVRYTDTYGYEWDNPAKGSFEYRDYLIRAFNDDIGFDQLLREQLAGDLLPQSRIHPVAMTNESLIGPMFYHLGEHRHGSSLMFNGIHQEMVNNKIDAFSKAFLGMTVACARCHDHKLEAIPQTDYYALAAVFTTPRWTSRVVDAPGTHDATIASLRKLRDLIRSELAGQWRETILTSDAIKSAIGDVATAKPQIHEIAYPLVRLIQRNEDIVTAWDELKAEWRTSREKRQQGNAQFHVLADFKQPTVPEGWVTEGDGIEHGYVEDATPLVALDGTSAVSRLLPRGYHSHALSSKLPGALRMPPEQIVPGKFVGVNVAGGEFGGYLVMDEHAFQNETVSFLNNVEPQWRSFADAELKNGVQQVTVEFATSSLNPNFPPRTGMAPGLANSDFGYDKRSWISITGIVTNDQGGVPQDELDSFAKLYEGDSPQSADEVWFRVTAWLMTATKRWCDGQCQAGDRQLLDWLLGKQLLPNSVGEGTSLAGLIAEYRRVEATIAFPRTVNSMDERQVTRVSYPLNVRGNVDVLGTSISPAFLQVFAGTNSVDKSDHSGRLELAESLLSPDHPLTSRVYVNRVWQWLFGTGLVATPDDFGHLGDRPSHPELLDWLAHDFVRQGWSTKTLVRQLVLTQTFRQSSIIQEEARQRDPNNRLWHYYPTRRLEAEAIRDCILTVSGRLDPQLYGRCILPPRAVEDGSKRLFSGPIDGHGRRSIYMQMSIMAPPKFLVDFNLPDLKLSTGRRDVTNVPAQALVLLNEPFVKSAAMHWTAKLIEHSHVDADDRIRAMFISAYARDPSTLELKRWHQALVDFAMPDNGNIMTDRTAWERMAHAFFNTKEFLYFR